ncbi:YgjP-like metallopeptidase domain-containing protein [Shewanella denitrificans]|jgi:UTP pyrophosphatase
MTMTKKPTAPPVMPKKASSQGLKPATDIASLMTSEQVTAVKSQQGVMRLLNGYSASVIEQVQRHIEDNSLASLLLSRHPVIHDVRTDKALYDYTLGFKNQFMRQSDPLAKVIYDEKITLTHQALGLHSFVNRVQGNKVKAKNEIRISSRLKRIPEPLLRMVVIHELAHLREKEHNKAFYKLCEFMLSDYHQLEFDLRLLLICEQLGQSPYEA